MKGYERLTERRDTPLVMSMWGGPSKELKIYNRLAELEDDLESGKMIRLPCKVGDTVWDIVKSINRTENTIVYKHIQEYQVERIEIDNYNLYLVITVSTEDGICEGYARPNQVYYTKAEAEAKLKELKGE